MIDPNIKAAQTLPSRFYFAPEIFEHDVRAVFHRTWQLMGASCLAAAPGDYFTFEVAGEPLLIARDAAGALRAFYNVCRHRAGPVAKGCGSRKVFRCGYHGWTYSLDGRLLNTPEFEGAENFPAEEYGLRPIAAVERCGLIFVNLGNRPATIGLEGLFARLARFGFDRLRFFERRDYIMECNWKVYIDNFLEGYHLPSVHPGLNKELDYGNYVTELFDSYNVQWSPIRATEGERERRYAGATGAETAEYFWGFPNWMLNCYPDNVSINMVLPLGPERTLARFEWYFPEAALATDAPSKTVAFSDEIQLEDARICEIVQRNLRSGSYDRGRYSPKQERGVHHFHTMYLALRIE
jgi:choline monooxygenase